MNLTSFNFPSDALNYCLHIKAQQYTYCVTLLVQELEMLLEPIIQLRELARDKVHTDMLVIIA